MDWLSTHKVSADCFTKIVVFKKPGLSELEFEGDRIVLPMCVISALKVKRLLHKDCEAYLAHVIDTSTPKITLENMPMVWEFSNMFPEDLSRLPPDRKLEFCIDLLPETALISISSYRN